MATPMILSKNGITIYPATIPQAIIDPETGLPAQLGGADVEYTINNQPADNEGNFTITAVDLGAASANHTHPISTIEGLQDALDGKASSNHTHNVVTSISVNGVSATGSINIVGTGNVDITKSAETINIAITPFEVDVTQAMSDANSNNDAIHIFTGTMSEWERFKQTISDNTRYIVFIRS